MAKSIKVARKVAKSNGKASKAVAKARKVSQPKPGTGIEFTDDTKLTVLARENPKRGASAERFAGYLKRKPKTVAAALAAGLTRADIRWDAGMGYIALAGVKVPARKAA